MHFLWSDERCVPPTDQESNFWAAREYLFSPLSIPAGQIHRLKGEAIPGIAAREASAELLRLAPKMPPVSRCWIWCFWAWVRMAMSRPCFRAPVKTC